MKLLELEVRNVRGLVELHLNFDGKNVVIWGSNGSGKSCVIDAIDFLFTGRIARLSGSGTAGITLPRHGPHIDHQPQSAVVTAKLRIAGKPDPVVIQRCIERPDNLSCTNDVQATVAEFGEVMSRGGVSLTRREILKYVTSEASERGRQIQEILNLEILEEARRSIFRARTELRRDKRNSDQAVNVAKAEVNVTLGEIDYSEDSLITMVNAARQILGGEPVSTRSAATLKLGISSPILPEGMAASVNLNLLGRITENIREASSSDAYASFETESKSLIENISSLESNPDLVAELELLDLTKHATKYVDSSTVECPVCGVPWPEGHLENHLKSRIATAEKAEEVSERISVSAASTVKPLQNLLTNVDALEKALSPAKSVMLEDDLEFLENWKENLRGLVDDMGDPLKSGISKNFDPVSVTASFSPKHLNATLTRIQQTVHDNVPQPSEEQTAWDTLTRLEENVRALENREREQRISMRNAARSEVLYGAFEKTLNDTLEDLYSRVADRFVELYDILHEHEREYFEADLAPDGGSLKFEVAFQGRGTHPPHALHSEGHQDSMGLCLFLALSEELAETPPSLILLDDVMMSVDSGHRKEVCRLIKEQFPECQFIITTHDRTWSRQLQQERVVSTEGIFEFRNWTIERGPRVRRYMDTWESIFDDVDQGKINEAASKLRRSSESFYEDVCDALKASITYNSRMEWQLDDWLSAATNQYKLLLQRARRAAGSWGNSELVTKYDELNTVRKQVMDRTHIDRWVINVAVHHNNWEDFASEDFKPVIEAFLDLQRLFVCSSCNQLARITTTNNRDEAVKCPCGTFNWNLRHKP